MLDFVYQASTKIFFGRGRIEFLSKEIKKYAQKVLLVYGGGSIKRIGVYDQVAEQLSAADIAVHELDGVHPNPRIDSVRAGIELCREHQIALVLAVGGGSVIDCAKAIAAGFYYPGDPWDFFRRTAKIQQALPVAAVLTVAATGSEMNGNMVISNPATQEKLGTGSSVLYPVFSILDPTYTFSLSAWQTAAGVADIMSHVHEQYFSANDGAFLQERLGESILKTCIKYGPLACNEPGNYEARANLMWSASVALNGLLSSGKLTDWATHGLEHEVSALHDVTHGVGLAILTPYWMRKVLTAGNEERFCAYARNVWNLSGADSLILAEQGIQALADFWRSLQLPDRLRDVGVQEADIPVMAKKATAWGSLGKFVHLTEADAADIYRAAF